MQFKDITIKEAVESVNRDYYIPVFQRQFKWKVRDIQKLFDSILKDYYIGSLLFWSLDSRESDGKLCYKFIDDYITEPVYPDSLEGTRRSELFTIESPQREKTLIIDGQQRLNSLYIGLRGSILVRTAGSLKKEESSWNKKELYINLTKNPLKQDSIDDFEFRFRESGGCTQDKYWYKVSEILSVSDVLDESERIKENAIQNGLYELDSEILESTLDTLHSKIHRDKTLAYYRLDDLKQSKMHKIFIRINESGTQLTSSDELLSRMTPVWYDTNESLPREEFNAFCDEMNVEYETTMGGYTLTPKEIVTFLYDTQKFGSTLNFTQTEVHLKTLRVWNNKYIQESVEILCSILQNENISMDSINKVDKRLLVYILYKRNVSGKRISEQFKRDLINLLILVRFNQNLNSAAISSAVNNVSDIEEIPFSKINYKLDSGLKFDVEAVVTSTLNRKISLQLLLLKLLDEDVSSSSKYTYKYTEQDPDNPRVKNILNRDYSLPDSTTKYVSDVDAELQSEKEQLIRSIDNKVLELLN